MTLRVALFRRAAGLLDRHRGLLSIAGGSAGGQFAAFLLLPVLSRLYTPADFGALAVITAYAITLATFATLRLELAVPMARSDSDAYRLVVLALAGAMIVATVVGVTLSVFAVKVADVLGRPEYFDILWMSAPLTCGYATYLVLAQAAVRQERLTAVGARNAFQPVVTTAVQALLGTVWPHAASLISGAAVGYGVGGASLVRPRHVRQLRVLAGPRELLNTLKSYRRYPATLLPAGVMNTLGLQLPVVFVAWRYGADSAGSFGMALRVLALPVTLVGTAVAQVYLSRMSKQVREGQGRATASFRRASRALALAGGLFVVSVIAFSPWAFTTVLGAQWREAGQYAQILSVAVAAQLVAVPLSQTLIATNRLGLQLAWDASRLCAVTAALLIPASIGWGSRASILTYSLASALMYLLMWVLCARAARGNDLRARPDPASEPTRRSIPSLRQGD